MHGEAGSLVRCNGLLQIHSRPDVDVSVGAASEADVGRLAERDAKHAVHLGNRAEPTARVGEAAACDRSKEVKYMYKSIQYLTFEMLFLPNLPWSRT